MSITYVAKLLTPDSWKKDVDWSASGCKGAGDKGCGGGMENPRVGYCECSPWIHRNLCQRPMSNVKCELGMTLSDLPPDGRDRQEIAKQVGVGEMSDVTRSKANCDVLKPTFSCKFNLPDPTTKNVIIPEIPKALRIYNNNKARFKVGDQYNDYMKQYCFSTVQSGPDNLCPNGETECPRYFQRASSLGGDAPRLECDLWSQTNPSEWDSRVMQYCNDPANLKKTECDCNAATSEGSNFHAAWTAFSKKPGQGPECWFEPCRRKQTQFLTKTQQDTDKCKGIDCANITVIDNSDISDTSLNQVVDCSCKVENGSCGPPASKGGCQSDSECSNNVKCISNQCGGAPTPPMDKCTGVICVAPSTCDPNTGQCTGTPSPSDKCAGVVCVNTTCDPVTGKCKDSPTSSKAWIWIVLLLLLVFGGGAYFFLRKKS